MGHCKYYVYTQTFTNNSNFNINYPCRNDLLLKN